MDAVDIQKGKTSAIIAYITIFGVLIAYFMNQDKDSKFAYFHIRQALGLWLTFFAINMIISQMDSWTATIAWYVFFGILFLYSFYTALSAKVIETPLVGKFYQKIFSGIGN